MAEKTTHISGLGLDNSNTTQPDANGELRYVAGTGFRFRQEGTVYTLPTSSGSATAYDDIADPDANGTIAFAGYTNTWTSTLDTGTVFTISNTDADLSADTILVDLKFTDDGDANGIYFRCLDNSGADAKFTIGANGATTIAGEAEGTAALTITAGDIVVTDGDVILTGGDLALNGDNEQLSFGASGVTDSYIRFSGTDLEFYDSTVGTTVTLAQLVSASPTGDFTIADGQFNWTDTTDENAGAWTFSGTTTSDITIGSAVTTGKVLAITADALSTGSMLYLDSDGIGSTGKYIACFDGSANDFTVGTNGAVVIAGVASTDVLTITAGDLQITAGDIDVDLGFMTIDNTADEGNTIKRNNATGTAAVLEIEETHATGGINLLLDTKNTTAAEYNLNMTSSGATQIHIDANGAAGDGILFDATDAHTGQFVKIDAGPWLGTAGEGAALDFRSDGAATAEAGHVIYIKMQGTGADAAAIEGKGLYIEDEGATQAGSYLVALDALANGALLVKAGISTFKGNVTLGVDATGVDFKAFGDTTNKFMVWDQSADDLILADAVALQLGGDESTADGFKIEFDGTSTLAVNALTGNDTIVVGGTTDTNLDITCTGGTYKFDYGAGTFIASAAMLTTFTGSGAGFGLVIPQHASASPSDAAAAGSIFFEVDANKLWVRNASTWVGVALA